MNAASNAVQEELPILVDLTNRIQYDLDEINKLKDSIQDSLERFLNENQEKPISPVDELAKKGPVPFFSLVDRLNIQSQQLSILKEQLYSINWKLKKLI